MGLLLDETMGRPGLPGLSWFHSFTSGCMRYCFVFSSMRSSVYMNSVYVYCVGII